MAFNFAIDNAHKQGEPDTWHIIWSLAHHCNYACPYCSKKGQGDCVLLGDRLLTMAKRALEPAHEFYDITFTGGEPSLHPFLPELIRYISHSGVNARINIETNGSRELSWHRQLMGGGAPVRFTITIHPAFANMRHMLSLIAMLAQEGCAPVVRLAHDPGSPAAADAFVQALARLHGVMHFDFTIQKLWNPKNSLQAFPGYTARDQQWCSSATALFNAHGTADDDIVCLETAHDQSGMARTLPNDIWCCASQNLLRIEPNGHFFTSACDRHAGTFPLWHPRAFIPEPQICFCRHPDCQSAIPPRIFASETQAREFIQENLQRARTNGWHARRPLDPFTLQPDATDALRMELKSLTPADSAQMSAEADFTQGQLWLKSRFDDVCHVATLFADAVSRETFLRAIRAIIDNDSRFLAESSTGPMSHPAMPVQAGHKIVSCGLNKEDIQELKHLVGANGQVMDLETMSLPDALADLWARRQCISFVIIKDTTEELLTRLKSLLYNLKPALILQLQGANLLDVPKWLKNNFSDWGLYLGCHPRHVLHAVPPVKPLRTLQRCHAPRAPLVSISLWAGSEANLLKETLDHLLLQSLHDWELVAIDDSGSSAIASLLAQYARNFPQKIRIANPGRRLDRAAAYNMGLTRALGKYAIFLQAGDRPGRHFLDCALNALRDADAEIFLPLPNDVLETSEKTFSGRQLAAILFEKCCRLPSMEGIVFSTDFLRWTRADFSGNDAAEDIIPLLKCLYLVPKVAVGQSSIYIHAQASSTQKTRNFSSFIDLICKVREFYDFQNLPLDSQHFRNLLQIIWREFLPGICADLKSESEHLPASLAHANLLKFGNFHTLILLGIETLTDLFMAAYGPIREFAVMAQDNIAPAIHAYGNADTPATASPMLSVVMYNHNKLPYLPAVLKSVLDQSMQDFELIIIDDASDDGSYATLCAYSERIANIRLYRLPQNGQPGLARNLAMTRARGRYLIFADSDTLCLPGYFADAINAMETRKADIALFSTQYLNEFGAVDKEYALTDAILTRQQVLRDFHDNILDASCQGKIFSRQFIADNDLVFWENASHEEEPFIYEAISKAGAIATSAQMACAIPIRNDNIPITNRHLHSAWQYMGFLHKSLIAWHGADCLSQQQIREQLKSRVESILLPGCAACKNSCGHIYLPDNDYAALKDATSFLGTLLIMIAEFWQPETDNAKTNPQILTSEPICSVVVHPQGMLDQSAISLLAPAFPATEIMLVAPDSYEAQAWSEIFQNDKRIKIQEAGKANILANTRGDYIIFMHEAQKLDAGALMTGILALENDSDTNLVIFTGSEQMDCPSMSGLEFLTACAGGEWNLPNSGTAIFRKTCLSSLGLDLRDDFTFQIHALAKAPKCLLFGGNLAASENMEIAQSGSSALRNLDTFLQSLDEITARLDSLTLEQPINDCIWKHYLTKHLAKKLAACAGSAENLEKVLTEERITAISSKPVLAANLLNLQSKPVATEAENPDSASESAPFVPLHIKQDTPNPSAKAVFCYINDNASDMLQSLKILEQKQVSGIEIIIVDDASTNEDTAEIMANLTESNLVAAIYQTPWHLGRDKVFKNAAKLVSGKNIIPCDAKDLENMGNGHISASSSAEEHKTKKFDHTDAVKKMLLALAASELSPKIPG